LALAGLVESEHAACTDAQRAGEVVPSQAAFDDEDRIAREQRRELDKSFAEQAHLDAAAPALDLHERLVVAALAQVHELTRDDPWRFRRTAKTVAVVVCARFRRLVTLADFADRAGH